jgi:hypothetical protein
MATFAYKALRLDGKITEGEIEAGGRAEAFRQMEGLGLRPIRLNERGAARVVSKPFSRLGAKMAAPLASQPETPMARDAVSASEGAGKSPGWSLGCWRILRVCFPACLRRGCR